jgi:hypothetical protein
VRIVLAATIFDARLCTEVAFKNYCRQAAKPLLTTKSPNMLNRPLAETSILASATGHKGTIKSYSVQIVTDLSFASGRQIRASSLCGGSPPPGDRFAIVRLVLIVPRSPCMTRGRDNFAQPFLSLRRSKAAQSKRSTEKPHQTQCIALAALVLA